jgi:hypothetical protein
MDHKPISQESPEGAANDIVAVLIREAAELNVECTPAVERTAGWISLTVWVNPPDSPHRSFYLFLRYVESQNIGIRNPAMGVGRINNEWHLILPPTLPFQWQLYRRDPNRPAWVPDYVNELPEHFLDSDVLQKLLRARLGNPPPGSL